jgi:hypothetical protein
MMQQPAQSHRKGQPRLAAAALESGADIDEHAGLAIALAAAVFFAMLGPRPDIAAAAETPRFLFVSHQLPFYWCKFCKVFGQFLRAAAGFEGAGVARELARAVEERRTLKKNCWPSLRVIRQVAASRIVSASTA